jgi:hypothetical protein
VSLELRRFSAGEISRILGLTRPKTGPTFIPVARPDDLLVLEVGWTDLELHVEGEGAEATASLATDGSRDGVLIVRFPPQAIEEDAYFETDLDVKTRNDKGKPAPEESTIPDVAGSRLAATSRLAFTVPKDWPPIPFTVAGLLDAFTKLPLRVHPRALPRQVLLRERIALRDLFDTALSAKALVGGVDPKALLLQRVDEGLAPLSTTVERALDERVAAQLGAPPGLLESHRDALSYQRVERFNAETLLVPDRPLKTAVLGDVTSIAASSKVAIKYLQWQFRPPAADETSIELPYMLVLSPHAAAGFAHASGLKSGTGGRIELWHSRLGTQTEAGVNDTDDAGRTMRAVWSRSGAPLGFPIRRGEPTYPRKDGLGPPDAVSHLMDLEEPYTSLDADDRWAIVHLSADFRDYRPEPIDVRRLMLSSLGGWLDSLGTWTRAYPGIALSEWRHLATMARDHYVRVVYEGMLFPFGHRAALVKVTERKFHKDPKDKKKDGTAYLRQRMFIVLRQRERPYSAPGIKNGDELLERTFPFHLIRIRTLVTPPLDHPNDCQLKPPDAMSRALFWPTVGGKRFLFDMVAETADGPVQFTAPAIFASFDGTGDPGDKVVPVPATPAFMEQARAAYEDADVSRVPLGGQRVTFAKPGTAGDTAFAAEMLHFGAHVLDGANRAALDSRYELPGAGNRKPCFFPRLVDFAVHVPAVQVLAGGTGVSAATWAKAYAREASGDGFGGSNPGEVLFAVTGGPSLDFSKNGNRSGGLVQPSFEIKGVSRKLGPVSGTAGTDGLQQIAAGSFNPSDFFGGSLGPKLFGAISLAQVIDAVGLDDLDAVPTFVTNLATPAVSLLGSLATLGAQTAALKAAAPGGALGTQVANLCDALAQDVADASADVSVLVGDPGGAPGFGPHLTTLAGHLEDVADLLDKLPPDVPGDVRNSLRTTVGSLTGLLGNVPTFVGSFKESVKLIDELTLRFDWTPVLKPVSVFVPEGEGGRHAKLVISVEAHAKSRVRPEPTIDVSARLTDFRIELIKGMEDFLHLRFHRVEFLAPAGRKPDVNVDFAGVEFVGVLSFVEALRSLIPLNGFSDPPGLTIDAEGIRAQYSIGLPTIAFGVFTLQNLSLGAGFSIPFVGKPLTVRFNFCERQQPFLLTVMAFGGGGYFMIAVDPAGVQQLEAGFEFGASLAMNFGVASGEVHVMGGFIYAMKDGNASLTGYLRIGGNVQALGIVSVSIELALELHFEPSSGKCVGRATLTIEVEIAFFSVDVEITCERKFAGSNGDPTFAEIVPKPAWRTYCEAFAAE